LGKREAWRKHPVFSNRNMFRNLLPGFGTAAVAFTIYVLYDNLVLNTKRAAEETEEHAGHH